MIDLKRERPKQGTRGNDSCRVTHMKHGKNVEVREFEFSASFMQKRLHAWLERETNKGHVLVESGIDGDRRWLAPFNRDEWFWIE